MWNDENDYPEWYFSIGWKQAGLISFGHGCARWSWDIHILPKYGYWEFGFGRDKDYTELCHFGLGPFLLIAWY